MNRLFVIFLMALLPAYTRTALAYEVKTHRELSERALVGSVLATNDSALLSLGLSPLVDDQTFPNAKPEDEDRTISQLLQDGSAFEDDGTRSRAHFFNPLNGYALFNVPGFIASPDWTLEDKGDFSDQADSFKDTRQFFFEALTLPSETERRVKWGRTFQGVGQVIHHLQDMAQPEHSRVDPHLTYTPDGLPSGSLPFEDPSRYEHYSGAKNNICDPPRSPVVHPSLPSPCNPYVSVHFETARQFWLTNNGIGAGIAEFTNNNFVSNDTNFINLSPPNSELPLFTPQYGYPLPASTGATVEVREFSELGLPPVDSPPPSPLAGKLYFIGTPIYDHYTRESGFNFLTSTYSIYDGDLKSYGLTYDCNPNNDPNYDPTRVCRSSALFTLNTFNFDSAHLFLIKRAIGYSAGLINYFFRGVGKIDLVEDPTDPTHRLLQNLGDEPFNGTFTVYYDDQDNNRHKVPGAEWTVFVPARGQVAVSTFPPPSTSEPTPKKPGEYLLVFKGTMGQETNTAVAATMIHPPAPESFLIDHRLSLTQDQATQQWVVAAEEDLQYGATNWIGEAGVLSYDWLTGTVYRGGRVLAVAPEGYRVSAAALQPDPDNPPHSRLVAILRLPSETGESATSSVWVKALAGTYREWQQQFALASTHTLFTNWRFNQAGTRACATGSRTSGSCTFTPKYLGSLEYLTYRCEYSTETYVLQVDIGTGGMTEQHVGSAVSISRSDDLNHSYSFYSGTSPTDADYRDNVLTLATATSTSEDEHTGSLLKGAFPYWQRSSYSRTVAIDGAVYFSSSGFREENWRWLYAEGIWEGSGMVDWTEAGFAALDLRGPWFVYTTSHQSGTATDGNPITESPGRWTTQSSFELGTNHDGVLLSSGNGALSQITWTLDRQDNVAFSLKMGEDTWINRLNGQDLGALTGLTGQIPAIGIR